MSSNNTTNTTNGDGGGRSKSSPSPHSARLLSPSPTPHSSLPAPSPIPPGLERSSSSSSGGVTPKISSPLNPNATSSTSSGFGFIPSSAQGTGTGTGTAHSTPTNKNRVLPPLPSSEADGYSSSPINIISQNQIRGRTSSASAIPPAIRQTHSSPGARLPSSSVRVDYARSEGPSPGSTPPSASYLGQGLRESGAGMSGLSLPDHFDQEALSSSMRARSRSRSPYRSGPDLHEDEGEPPSPTSLTSAGRGLFGSPKIQHKSLASSWWGEKGEDEGEKEKRKWKEGDPWAGSEGPKKKKTVSQEHVEVVENTRQKVARATAAILGTAADVAHEALYVSVDLLDLAPVPGLATAARTLLNIWDACESVGTNFLSCLRLTERCADILLSIREEIHEAGDVVDAELKTPVKKLDESFLEVHRLLDKQTRRPFLKRYLKRDEIMGEIQNCDTALRDALALFSISIQIRILHQVQEAERKRAEEAHAILQAIYEGRPLPRPKFDPEIYEVDEPEEDNRGLDLDDGGLKADGGLEALQAKNYSSETVTAHFSTTSDALGLDLGAPPSSTFPGRRPLPLELNDPPLSPLGIGVHIFPQTPSTASSSSTTSSTSSTSPSFPISSSAGATQKPVDIITTLEAYHTLQNSLDTTRDLADLRRLMRDALQAGNDARMVEVLQIGRQEMPDAIKTLQRALERIGEQERAGGVDAGPPEGVVVGKVVRRVSLKKIEEQDGGQGRAIDGDDGENAEVRSLKRSQTVISVESSSSSSGTSGGSGTGTAGPGSHKRRRETLDREFIETGIDALRRMSGTVAGSLPSWTITKYEIDRESKIGVGFFSDVYKGKWRNRTVAIKVLADTTPRNLFIREIGIWKTLSHRNVLPLYGASSASGDPPWFFVSPYLQHGSLNQYLHNLEKEQRPVGVGVGVGANIIHRRAGTVPGAMPALGAGSSTASTLIPSPDFADEPIPKEWDLFRFMHEIAKGMEYLHHRDVLHGDLKAANVLVDDRLHCLIADFGLSEMKSEAYRISGTQPPHGGLRWQAPELMSGQELNLTAAMDVWAFSITCVEVLTFGRVPWPLHDDEDVRRFVLRENTRPSIPLNSRFTTPGLQLVLKQSWAFDPALRPTFKKIAKDLKLLRKALSASKSDPTESPYIPTIEELQEDTEERQKLSPSPDMRPTDLPAFLAEMPGAFAPLKDILSYPLGSSGSRPTKPITFPEPQAYPAPYTNPHSAQTSQGSLILPPLMSASGTHEPDKPNDEGGRAVSLGQGIGSVRVTKMDDDGYESPPPCDERTAGMKNEMRYRMLLAHEFHPSLVLPLWHPTPTDIGSIGFLSRPKGEFVTLFNALTPLSSSHPLIQNLPSIHGYGRAETKSHMQDKRSLSQRGFDSILGWLGSGFGSKDKATSSASSTSTATKDSSALKANPKANRKQSTLPTSRTHTHPLHLSHKTSLLIVETTEYRYFLTLDAPKKWFKAHIDIILKAYGERYNLTREDVFLVVGALRAPQWGVWVGHRVREGHVNFNVHSSQKAGQPWGHFSTDTILSPSVSQSGPVAYDQDDLSSSSSSIGSAGSLASAHSPPSPIQPSSNPRPPSNNTKSHLNPKEITASKVSLVGSNAYGPLGAGGGSSKWDSVLLARLRFKPDALEPTAK